jgi:osmotically-inducible protein OsmY
MFRARRVQVIEPGALALAMLASMGIGAALMYFLDPVSGRRRRWQVADQIASAGRSVGDATGSAMDAAVSRTRGYLARARQLVMRQPDVDDATLIERVRVALARVIADSHALEVRAHEGAVTLKGPVRADQIEEIVGCVERVEGVCEVDNRLSPNDSGTEPPRDALTH